MLLPPLFISCEDFIEVAPPKTELISETVFTDNATATAAISAVYFQLVSGNALLSGGRNSVMALSGFCSDELLWYSSNEHQQFYLNSIIPMNSIISQVWGDAYSLIYKTNAILEGLDNATGVTPSLANQLKGEAMFIRSFVYFYLYNLFGDVPYITTTDYRQNNVASRTATSTIIQGITNDLLEAKDLLTPNYSLFNNERVRVNRWAATALLSRVYLYRTDWANAEAQASEVIGQEALYGLSNINEVFLKNSQEAIWQLKPTTLNLNSNEGFSLMYNSVPSFASIREELYNAFELTDLRRNNWITAITDASGNTTYRPYKYKIRVNPTVTEYSTLLRLAEQYLIRAEARAKQSNIFGSQEDINMIRSRAGLAVTPASDEVTILLAIEQERRLELFVECGHRWLDLKRTGRAISVLSAVKPTIDPMDLLFPIPQSEILVNRNLTQNDGYEQ